MKLHNLKSKYVPNLTRFKANEDDDELQNLFGKSNQLGYFSSQKVSTCLSIPIDENIKDAQYYRQVVNAIANTGEDDVIQFEINSCGGDLAGLCAILTALSKTEALTIANINYEAHSAASMLALSCQAVYVSPHASMLCHFLSTGTSGKASDIKSHINHVYDTGEKLFRETYDLFLTEDEIEKCILGLELWLSSDEINRRLEYKYSILNQLEEDQEKLSELILEKPSAEPEVQSEVEPEVVPKAKRSRKPKVES